IAIVALVERLILQDRNAVLAELLEHDVERALCPDERRRERDVEAQALRFQLAAGSTRFGDALLAQIDVAPSGEQVLEIPLALAVANEHEKTIGHDFLDCTGFRNFSGLAHRPSNTGPEACRGPTARP